MGNSALGYLRRVSESSMFSRPLQIVMIGLDNAGKTTILYRMKFNEEITSATPTAAFNVETIRLFKNLKFLVWDTAGSELLRPLWRAYVRKADGIIFVVDSCERTRFDEARAELDEILNSTESEGIPLLILANKQDASCAVTPGLLEYELELDNLSSNVDWLIQPTSGLYGDGLQEAFIKLYAMIEKRKKTRRSSALSSSLAASSISINTFQKSQVSPFV